MKKTLWISLLKFSIRWCSFNGSVGIPYFQCLLWFEKITVNTFVFLFNLVKDCEKLIDSTLKKKIFLLKNLKNNFTRFTQINSLTYAEITIRQIGCVCGMLVSSDVNANICVCTFSLEFILPCTLKMVGCFFL